MNIFPFDSVPEGAHNPAHFGDGEESDQVAAVVRHDHHHVQPPSAHNNTSRRGSGKMNSSLNKKNTSVLIGKVYLHENTTTLK